MAERLTEVELDSIALLETMPRSLSRDPSLTGITQENDIETAIGLVHVAVQGERGKPAIITYHDIGLNAATCFQGFFSYPDMQVILKKFCVYHINAPGQQEGALPLPQGLGFTQTDAKTYEYPTMDQLAEAIVPVMDFYNIKSFIGFGVGAGANVLARFSMIFCQHVDGLVLINCTASKAGWTEWGYQKMNTWHLSRGNLSVGVEEYLLWHWFGNATMEKNHDLVNTYSSYVKAINPTNLGHFISAFIKRTDLGIVRELDPLKRDQATMIRSPVMLVTGSTSSQLNDTVDMNGRMDPNTCTWVKFDCGGMVLEEAPNKLTESFRLFLQGLGYVPSLKPSKSIELTSLGGEQSRYAGVAASSSISSSPNSIASSPEPVML